MQKSTETTEITEVNTLKTSQLCTAKLIALDIYTWNVNGLKSLNKSNLLQNYQFNNPGVYLLQETHKTDTYIRKRLSSNNCIAYIKEGDMQSSGVTTQIPVNEANLTQNPTSFNLSDQNHRLLYGNIIWFGKVIMIINLYAPSGDSRARASLFNQLDNLLEEIKPDNIILGGDFNCVIDPILDLQKEAKSPNNLNEQDQMALRALINRHNLTDIWRKHHPESLQCTYGLGKGPKTSRLDKFYISSSIEHLVTLSEIITNSLSDHNPVHIKLLSPDGLQSYKSSWRLNAKVLLQDKFKSMTRNEIQKCTQTQNLSETIDTWYSKTKGKLRRKARRYAIGNCHKLRNSCDKLKRHIESIEQQNIYADPMVTHKLITKVQSLKLHLEDLQKQAFSKAQINASTTSADTSEKATTTFFGIIQFKQRNMLMSALIKKDGTIARTQSEISETSCEFYEDLYQLRETSPQHIQSLLNTIQTKVQTDYKRKLDQPITAEEVSQAISWIASAKAPGPDGLGSEFFKTFKTELSPILAEVYNQAIQNEALPDTMTNATIHLLFKKGDPQSLGNWRPISLLNVDYKILAIIINNRIKEVLPDLLHEDQKGFVPTRRLEDAVLKATHIINHCKRHQIPAYLMLLDQEKAFDRVSRDYLHAILDTFGFPDLIKKAVKAMYASTTANIAINGQLSRKIKLQSGVRQGCPLSPTLFAMCIEPLGNLIRNNPSYTGIRIPDMGAFKISKFADDTTFFVLNQNDHNIALEAIQSYELASAAKANVSKTEILPIGPNTHSQENPLVTDISVLPYDTDVRFLGVKIGNQVNTDAVWNDRILALEKNLQRWSQKSLTYEGKIFVLKQQALASIWFQAKFHPLSKIKIKEIGKIVKNFINSGKSRSLIPYHIITLPKHMGGLGAPNIELYYQTIRMSWIYALLDNRNPAEWKKLANLEIDEFSGTKNMGLNILQYPKRLTRENQNGFWQDNIKFFHALGGTFNPKSQNLAYTPFRLLNESLSTFCDSELLNRQAVTKTKQIIHISEECKPTLLTPKTLKTQNLMPRILGKRIRKGIEDCIPTDTVPPKHFLEDEKEHNDPTLYEVAPVEDSLFYKRLKLSKNHPPDEKVFEYTESPSRPYNRNLQLELNEVVTQTTPSLKTRLLKRLPEGPLANPVDLVTFKQGQDEINLSECKISDIYWLQIAGKNQKKHHRFEGYEELGEADWSLLPNTRLHPASPKLLKNYRFQILHNRLFIGRQLTHIPGIELFKIKCQFCDTNPNNIKHMLLECPQAIQAWSYLTNKWSTIVGSFEDFTDPHRQITNLEKLLGIESQTKPKPGNVQQYNEYIFNTTLDLLLGNMQYSMIKIYKHYLNNKRSNIEQIKFLFDFQMELSISKIFNRMKRKPYHKQWIFTRPLPESKCNSRVNTSTWEKNLQQLIKSSLAQYSSLEDGTETINAASNPNHNQTSEISSSIDSELF